MSLTGGDQGLRGGIPRPAFLGIDLAEPRASVYSASCALLVIGLLPHAPDRAIAVRLYVAHDPRQRERAPASSASTSGAPSWTIFVSRRCSPSTGGIIMALFVSGAYPEFAYWTISGEGDLHRSCSAASTTFLGPMVGTVILR